MKRNWNMLSGQSIHIVRFLLARQLVEQGKVKLDEPVENILPEIKDIRMVDGSEPKNKITLRMLVSDSSACCA